MQSHSLESDPIADELLRHSLSTARQYKEMAETALARVEGEAFFTPLNEEGNSLAVLVKHLGGNLRSRWRDFLTTDGEKADRHRDREFAIGDGDDREALMRLWEEGWGHLLGTLEALGPEDLGREVIIRSEPLGVVKALLRGLTHLSYHVGQIVELARHFHVGPWESLSIPRGGSSAYTRNLRARLEAEEEAGEEG